MIKLNRLSRVKPARREEMDSVAESCVESGGMGRALDVLLQAQTMYANMHAFRRERERNKKYTYGQQWSDVVCVEGERMLEEEYIRRQGNVPLVNNLIKRLVRNVIGVYRSQVTEPTCIARDRDEQKMGETMSTVLQYNMSLNRMTDVYARTMEEFLISGMIVHRKWFGRMNDKEDCWTEYVQPNNFFIDTNMRDFRMWDCQCLGEIHDVSFNDVCNEFAEGPGDYAKLAEIYRVAKSRGGIQMAWEQFGRPMGLEEMDFLVPRDESRCRVIEVWRKESKPRYWCHDYNNGDVYKIEIEDYREMVEEENRRRLMQGLEAGMAEDDIPMITAKWYMDSYWYYYYLTPFGDVLKEGETPYAHKSHPYVFKAYPFIDGEIHSFVNDVIDQQRYTNRLITLYDWIMRSTAKGVLLVPQDCIPKGMSPEDFADTWTRLDGVIVYTPSKSGDTPRQVSSNSTNIGIQELLNLQLKFFEDISGVNGALQGKPGYAGMSAALYSQQTQNATTSLLDLLDTFGEFVRDAAYKDVKNIQQYYDKKRVFNIAGKAGTQLEYDPQKIRDVEFDLSIIPSTATPAYRAAANDFLMQLWQRQAISLEQLLQAGNFPFADELMQSIKSQKEQLAQGQVPEGLSPQLMAQVQQGANMDAVKALQRGAGG